MPKKVTPRGKAATSPKAKPAAAKKKATTTRKKSSAKNTNRKFVRNVRFVQCRVTLDEKRILLEPRGQRGDLAAVSEEQQEDPIFESNIGMIYEVLEEADAKEILRKQANNQQVGPTTLDHLLNERGEKYEQGVKIEEAYEKQGEVVADITKTGQGRHSEKNEQITRRASGAAPEQVERPGSRPLTEQEIDEIARRVGEGDGETLKDAYTVRVEPTQKG